MTTMFLANGIGTAEKSFVESEEMGEGSSAKGTLGLLDIPQAFLCKAFVQIEACPHFRPASM